MKHWNFTQHNRAQRIITPYTLVVESIFLKSHKWTSVVDNEEELWKWSVLLEDCVLESGHDTSFENACFAAEFCVKELQS